MAHWWLTRLFALGLALLGVWSTPPAGAETLSQSTLDTRIALAFRVSDAALRPLVPAPWQPAPAASGPSKDANLVVSFVERLLDRDAEGKPAAVPSYRLVALAIPVKHPETGEAGPLVVRIFNSNPQAVPGFYKTAVQATVQRELTLKGTGVEPGTVTESWQMRHGGGMIDLRIQYQRGTPTHAKSEARPRSGADPTIWRIYRIEQGLDVVKSVPAGIDRVRRYQFRVTVPELAGVFDGSEQLVSITAIPWYTRQTFLP